MALLSTQNMFKLMDKKIITFYAKKFYLSGLIMAQNESLWWLPMAFGSCLHKVRIETYLAEMVALYKNS